VRSLLQHWLVNQAQRRPEAVAVVFQGQPTTYGDLDLASNSLARALKAAGCTRGDRLALLLPKSPRALVAMLGALKADCMYVPVDTTNPISRIERIVHLCECRCLLAEGSSAAIVNELLAPGGAGNSAQVLWMDNGADLLDTVNAPFRWQDIEGFSSAPVDSHNSPDDPAHILFTSGSTGMPKGVVITHSNVVQFIRWAVQYFGMDASDRVSCHPPLHFDLSTFDIYGALAAGAQLHLVPPEINLLPHRLGDFIRNSELTQWFSVPSALLPMARFDVLEQDDFPALRRLLWCGERFPTPALIYWMRHLPHVTFVNLYGPTEATIASSYYHVPRCPEDDHAPIPIGVACDGETLLVLDEQMRPAAPEEIGDLFISGVGLSPGYWKDPAKTAEAFRQNPNGVDPSDRIYKTGDLAKAGKDGLIYLIGRSDAQIKSRGYRIELGEIEAAIQAVPGVQDTAVVALDLGDTEGVAICCAYVLASGCDLVPAAIRKQVAQVLPHYMIPTRWQTLDLIPRTGTGKTDRALVKQRFCEEAGAGGHAATEEPSEHSTTESRGAILNAS
jgi:amino acid adenylation domain-containing protein